MDQNEIVSALVAFMLGLLAKIIYDVWGDRRKRRSLVITKTVLSAFTLSSLDEGIRDQMEVSFNHHPIDSVRLLRVEVENRGSAAVKNQALTVRFSDKAQIVGEPNSESSTEDLRYIEIDNNATAINSRRIKINLLRKGSQLAWNFAVINHELDDFVVEHGISDFDEKFPVSDLEVSSNITSEKISPDVTSRIRRIFVYLLLTQITSLISGSFVFGLQEILRPIGNLLTIFIWVLLIKEIVVGVVPILEWIRSVSSRQEIVEISGDITSSNIAVATKTGSARLSSSIFDKNTLRAILEQAEALSKMGTTPTIKAKSDEDNDD